MCVCCMDDKIAGCLYFRAMDRIFVGGSMFSLVLGSCSCAGKSKPCCLRELETMNAETSSSRPAGEAHPHPPKSRNSQTSRPKAL